MQTNILLLFLAFLANACTSQKAVNHKVTEKETSKEIVVAAMRTSEYLPILKGKNVALVVNQTSMIGNTHLVDSLVSLGISVKKIFSPEHGFRGDAEAGEKEK